MCQLYRNDVVVVSVGPGVVVAAVDVVTACCLSPWRPLATAALPPVPRLNDQLLSLLACSELGREEPLLLRRSIRAGPGAACVHRTMLHVEKIQAAD